jgi:hypothetical protein
MLYSRKRTASAVPHKPNQTLRRVFPLLNPSQKSRRILPIISPLCGIMVMGLRIAHGGLIGTPWSKKNKMLKIAPFPVQK